MFSLRIVTVDHYLSIPLQGLDVSYSNFRGCEIKHVPVIRIFGTTPKGKKACLHVHGVFPYISIPFDGGGYERPEKFIQQLALSIDKALNAANGNYSHVQHVYKISLLAGIPFYGYHEKEQRFLRIFFYNPVDVKRTIELLQNGTIMNQIMQPHEAHIPYILQFFIDYSLYGMDMINICAVKFRKSLDGNSQTSTSQSWNTNELNCEVLADNVQRQSSCELEMDCCAKDILNKQEETDTPSMNPGLAVMWEEERQRQEKNGKILQLTPPASNERDKVEPSESEVFYMNRLKSIIGQISESSKAVEDSLFEEIADKELVSSLTPASIIEIHTPDAKEQKETAETDKEEELNSQDSDKTLTQNSLNEEKKFLDMIISMIDSQTINSPEDADSILSTQEPIKDNEQESNKDDDLESLEMSQCIWDENVCLDSKLIKQGYSFSKAVDREAIPDKFSLDSLIIRQENCSTYGAKKFSSDSLDDFIIPQIDGTHDTLCQNNDDEKKSNKYPGRQIACNSASSCYLNSNMEGSWMQKSSSSNLHEKYDCHNGIYTPFNQATYCVASNSHYTNYSKSANQTGLLMCSQNLSNNINWYSNPSTNYCNPSITYQSSTESNCVPFLSTYRITPMIPENACSTEKNEVYRNNLNYSHITPSTSNYKEFEKTVSPSYKVEGGMKFSTIDTTANLKIFSKDLVFGKSADCSKNQTSDLFDTLKTNINKVGIQIYPHKFITAKPKSKEVCNMSTQTNCGLVNTAANEEKKTENEKKSNPRTLVVQNMKRLQLSRRQAQQQTSATNTKVSHEDTTKNKKVPLTKEKINIPFYPLIHRPAPELNLKMNISNISCKKVECKNNAEKNSFKPNLSVMPLKLNGLILPPYIDKKDLVKIGKERVVLKRLGKNCIDKNCVIVKNNYCSDVLKVTKQSLSALKMRFKMSRIKTLSKFQELKNSKFLTSNSTTNQTKESCLFQSSDLKNVLNPQNDNQEMNHLPKTTDKKKLPLKLTIKLPNSCSIKQTRIRKRKRKNYFKAFQPSISHKILNLADNQVDHSSTLATSRSKRRNVNYRAHAYSHLLEFDKFVELPGDRRRIFMSSKKKKTDDLIKQCKKVEVRLERLKPENLNKMNLHLDKENLSKLLKTIKSDSNPVDKTLNSKSYQYVNVYPISVDTSNSSSPDNYNTGNNDYNDEYSDVMWNLSYLSPMTNVQRKSSPPQCWSPNNNKINKKNVKTKDTRMLKNKISKNLSQSKSKKGKQSAISVAEESGNTSDFSSAVSSKDDVDLDINLMSFNNLIEKPVMNGVTSVHKDSSTLPEKISNGNNDQSEPERQLENNLVANCVNENSKIDIEMDNNKEIITKDEALEIDNRSKTSGICINLKKSLSGKDLHLLDSQDIDNTDVNKSDIETVSCSVEERTSFVKEVHQHRDDTPENELPKELNNDLLVKVKNENVEGKLEIDLEFEDKLEIDDTQDMNKDKNSQNISTGENCSEEISVISKENVNDEQSESMSEEQAHHSIDNSFNDTLNDDKHSKENLTDGSDAENEISSSNELFSMEDNDESIFLTQKNCSRSENEQIEICNSSFSVMDELEMLQQKQSSAESNSNDCLQLSLSENSNNSSTLAASIQDKHDDSLTNLSNNENDELSKAFQNDEEYDISKESITDSNIDKTSEPGEMCLVISDVKSASTDIDFDDTLEESDKADGQSSSYISSESISNSVIPETQESGSFDLNTTLDNSPYINNVCSLQKDCLPVNMMSTSSNDLDLAPLSPEEKTIYDSEGNIVSANTFSSQYSICLGDHNLNENENQDFPEAVNLHSASILSSYMLMKNKLSKSAQENEKNLQISNENQEVLSASNREEERISSENENKNVLPSSSSSTEDYTESTSAEPTSKEVSVAKDDESLKDICTQLCNQACLIHNNMLETQKTKNALLVGPFKEVSFVFPTETDSEFYSDKSNLPTPELIKVSNLQSEAQSSVIQLNNEKLTCRMCYGTAKNDCASVKIYQCKYCENVIQPFDIKGEEIMSDCIKTDMTLKILEAEKTEEISKCSLTACEEKQEHNESITIQVENIQGGKTDQEFCETSVIVSNTGAEMASESRIQCLQDQEQTTNQEFCEMVIKIDSADAETVSANMEIEKSVSSDSKSISERVESLNESKLLVSEDKCNPSNDLVESEGSESSQNCESSTVLSFYDATVKATNENQKVNKCSVITPLNLPPTYKEVKETLSYYNLPEKKYQIAYYSNPLDDTNKVMEVADAALKIPTTKLSELLEFDGKFQTNGLEKWQNYILGKGSNIESSPGSSFSVYEAIKQNPKLKVILSSNKSTVLTPTCLPPIKRDVKKWLTLQKPASKVAVWSEDKTEDIRIVTEETQTNCSFGENSKREVSFYRSTPKLDGQKCRKRKRSNSWNGDKTSESGKLSSKRRRLSEDFPLDNTPNIKLSDVFPKISPICSLTPNREKEKIFNKKRKLSVEFSKCDLDKTELSEHSSQPKQDSKKKFHNQNKVLSSYSLNSDIEGPTLSNNFKVNFGNIQETNVNNQHQFLTIMSMEIHVETREDLQPDPQHDSIKALFYCINNDFPKDGSIPREVIGMIIVRNEWPSEVDIESSLVCNGLKQKYSTNKRNLLERSGIFGHNTIYVADEICLIKKFIEIVREWDPDMICGYEIQMSSWGYLIQRAAYLNLNMYKLLSRTPGENPDECNNVLSQKDDLVIEPTPEFKIIGRVILNVWKIMRREVNLNIYTFENVVYHVLHLRLPQYSFRSLTHWFDYQTDLLRWRVVDYYITRVKYTVNLLNQLDVIGRTSTLARVFGIQFYEVLSRGTQFRVESMMLRTAKPQNYIAVSPGIQQRAHSKAPERFALVMEPESKFYTSPVVVLDFQSLYPSMIIAYNYCYSTCLGRVEHLGNNTPFEFGCTSLNVPPSLLKKLENDILISPNGVAFVKHHVRLGILPKMLEDILNTRIMIKNVMKEYKEIKPLYKLLDARQLGLKLIANVTYGYTSANFSGRMPCVEIADSIVGKARETLEQAIKLIETTTKWNAKVVYGDTDSVFVLLEGRSKEQAFKIGKEIAEAVTAVNPKPVKLKFEKVYLPCLLQTKKRYVGYMYETPDQTEPIFDAKGIETIRRDSCPAVGKILEKSLKILFNTRDVSLVKKYVQKQLQKLVNEKASLQDYIFAKEYRGRSGYSRNACVPALEIAKRITRIDPRAEPRVGERVPYVVVYGSPGLPLIQLIRQPQELLQDPGLKINSKYYIGRVILPPLHRAFSLIGVDVTKWYDDIPHPQNSINRINPQGQCKGTLSQYFTPLNCAVCNELTDQGICSDCKKDSQYVVFVLNEMIRKWERKFHHLSQICQTCTRTRNETNHCISLDCPILFKLCLSNRDLSQVTYLRQLQSSLDF